MAAKKRRGPKHPGVVLRKPNPKKRMGWRASFNDPDTGKRVYVKLPPELTTLEQRDEWAVDKSRSLAERRLALEKGAPRATGTDLDEAVKRYFRAHPHLRARTLEGYQAAADKLTAWAASVGLTSADHVTRAKLMAFREALIQEPKMATVKGGQRGERADSGGRRSAESVNSAMRKAQTVLGYLVDLDLLPRLTRDDLRRAFKRLPVTTERLEYMRVVELRSLLEAAARHDAETFTETRAEHVGEGRRRIGSTARYDAIAPFTAFVLLTGCRFGEALALEWKDVDLAALDHDGRKVGELHLRGAATKTHRARTVGLEVSPALFRLLAALKLATGGKGSVFGLSEGTAQAAARRLRDEYGAPDSFTWQALRRTCGTFLTNAPGIFGAASAYRSAKQLGHSVAVAERHYVGVVRGIPAEARTLEAAMQLEATLVSVSARGTRARPLAVEAAG